jgi:hypothetical protein
MLQRKIHVERTSLEHELKQFNVQIDKIVEVIRAGMFHAPMMVDDLEKRKTEL